ncbi:UDP-N-acetylglucosamine transferase subunit ALG14 [Denticeps clupeoides]|uniref:UDP-N-acetylglucosamine transferase subunit ALG14 n=1 Tax=Denticeps clupeoides TaxID=299321 RepID=A0AAY4C693_9TELE|nr:UDP-N-acetylglucosamine transferase subunit ALG14 homolog [Denticeps clupeoides]XP_028825494.1 UDP-N-acetylglucosamine transferase subunit ALG14 homolog [Denticeps clupeoides]XP_028825496.1 UDP-N-acetylglucosamine transferase subunit ALG14 homolog [Denticeps clupeoides]
MHALWGILAGLCLVGTVLFLRFYIVLRNGSDCKPGRKGCVSLLVVAGSGGHTAEILRLVASLSQSYSPRHYVLADTDRMSEEKIHTFESSREEKSVFTIHRIPRSREVRQSWSSSVISTLYALLYSIPLVFRLRPDVVLCNGPGTCVPLCAGGLLLGVLGVKRVLIVYVESICRVESLSLSGKLLYPVADYFFVQWENLKAKYPRSIYLGRIV